MERAELLQEIAVRTAGDLYIGVVGPVRTGKSTLVRRMMEVLVLPRIQDPALRARAIDELPQGGAGRTVMTSEPKFVPEEAIAIPVDGMEVRVRFIDSVGFPVEGALGYEEAEGPRMVTTPWFEYEIPFEEAADYGTRKVIQDHSTVGLVVTTDGSFGELPRAAFVPAERRTVEAIRDLGKPFIIVLNTVDPRRDAVTRLAAELRGAYGVPVIPLNVQKLDEDDVHTILLELLYEFPVTELTIQLPRWVEELEPQHWLRAQFQDAVEAATAQIRRLRDVQDAVESLQEYEFVAHAALTELNLGTGAATIEVATPESLFWQVLEEITGFKVEGKENLLRLLRDLSQAKRAYDKIGGALQEAMERGYGVVPPTLDEMRFEEPELIRRGNQFGVRLRASAPALHLFRADISAEVTPMIGTEKQSEQLVNYLMEKFEDDPRKIWESDIFGKPLSDLLREGIHDKLFSVPPAAQAKLRETLERIVDEGSAGLICIIL